LQGVTLEAGHREGVVRHDLDQDHRGAASHTLHRTHLPAMTIEEAINLGMVPFD
jgi:hypothetical protein